jgi:6-pyruvoyltetrahydropterin/6-carboxytetrahydropterin synthase
MAYEVRVRDTLHACHAILMPGGQLEPRHWHRWGIEVVFEGPALDRAGVLIDFEVVKHRLREVLNPLEGAQLNDHSFMEAAAPSAENLARRLYEHLSRHDWGCARLAQVVVREAPGCRAAYGLPRPS